MHPKYPVCERVLLLFVLLLVMGGLARGQRVPYAGVIGGIATLSADAGSRSTSTGLALSGYSADNGGALNVFAGVHLHNYLSLQANYIWNQNDLVLNSAASDSDTFYKQARSSSQHTFVIDVLGYFRKKGSRIRPYLGTGIGLAHLISEEQKVLSSGGGPMLPPQRFTSNRPVLRVHVGMDLRLTQKMDFRYSFSEMIGKNDISRHLTPPGPRRLANFQNLFGFVMRF